MCLMVGSNALVINFTVMSHIHQIMQNPISKHTYAFATKIFSSNGNETQTHEVCVNTYAARTAEVESTELPVHEEEWQILLLGESPDIQDEGDTSTRDSAGEAVKPILRLRGGCRLSDVCSIGSIDEDDLSSHGSTPSMREGVSCDDDEGVMSCHSGTPSIYEGDSSDEDASVVAIADAPPTLVDDVDSRDDESSVCDTYEERTMIGDESAYSNINLRLLG